MSTDGFITPQASLKLRGLSLVMAIMVVLSHASTTLVIFSDTKIRMASPYLSQAQIFVFRLCSIAVPTFYFLAGLLFFATFEPTRAVIIRKYRSRAASLLLPYLIWSALGIALYWLLQQIPLCGILFPDDGKIIDRMSAAVLFKTWLASGIAYQFWFLRYLMLLVALAPLLHVVLSRVGLPVLLVIFAVWFTGIAGAAWRYALEALWFFSLGSWLAIRRPMSLDARLGRAWLLLAAWLALLALDTQQAGDFRQLTMLRQAIVLTGVAAAWFNWPAFRPVLESAPALWTARFSFFIYAAHLPAITILSKLVVLGVGKNDVGLSVAYVAGPVLAIGLAVLACWALRRICPRVYAVLSGGR